MMRLRAITLQNFRSFVAPTHLDAFDAGLNLITGPNGAGKSTVVRALRAAFFMFHRSRQVKDLVPWSAPGESPAVTVEFELDDGQYRLSKQFLKGAFAELQTPTGKLTGEEAEQRVAELFGFQVAARGETKPEGQGIPGLLWVEQGAAPDLDKPIDAAGEYLRDSLTGLVGAMASSDGDEVLQQLEDELATMRVRGREKKAGSSKGELLEATEKLKECDEQLQHLNNEIALYRQRVDELGHLRAACATDRRDSPWLAHEASAVSAQAELDKLNGQRDKLRQSQAELGRLQADIKLIESQIEQRRRLRESLGTRRKSVQTAQQELTEQTQTHQAAQTRLAQALKALDEATAVMTRAEQAEQLSKHAQRLVQLREQRKELASRQQAADAAQQTVRELTQELARRSITAKDIEQLRKLDQQLALASERANVMATQIEFDLVAGDAVKLDGAALSGQGSRSIATPARIDIDGVGSLTVRPGGTDLEAGIKARERAQQALAEMLDRLGLDTTSAAVAAHDAEQIRRGKLQLAQARVKDLAPEGLEQLQLKSVELDAEIGQLQAEHERLQPLSRPADAGVAEVSVTAATEALGSVRLQHEQAVKFERQAADALSRARSACQHAEQELAGAELASAEFDPAGPAEAESDQALMTRAADLREQIARRTALTEELEQQLATAMPDTLAQDVKRHRESAATLREQARMRELAEARLSSELAQAGASGLDEQLQRVQAEQERWARRQATLNLRADALAWLVERMRQRRDEYTERLQAPLQTRMNHYLRLLMPGATLALNNGLAPVALVSGAGPAQQPVNDQSFGTREQLMLLARLSYADLLAEAGRPTLIILDDGLLHADAGRLEQMKRMLYDAAQRHQMLLFSCHPERWSGLGVAPRPLPTASGAIAGTLTT